MMNVRMKSLSKNSRQSGFELLRTLMMLQVVFLHVCSKEMGAFTQIAEKMGGSVQTAWSLSFFMSRCPVLVFVMITGYFSVQKYHSWKDIFPKLKHTYGTMYFYSVMTGLVLLFTGCVAMTKGEIISLFLPMLSDKWYFMTLYVLLLLFIPIMNRCLATLSQKEYTGILLLLFFLFSIMPVLTTIEPFDEFISLYRIYKPNGGKGIYSFLFAYMIGGYLRMYAHPKKLQKGWCLVVFILAGLVNAYLALHCEEYYQVAPYNTNPFVLLQSVCLMLFFSNCHFQSRLVNSVASSCMAVYMIHMHPQMIQVLWSKIFPMVREYSFYQDGWYLLRIAGVILAIFSVCILIDKIRLFVCELLIKNHHYH